MMAVEDHPVHPTVMRASDAPYGCKDREFAKGYWTMQRTYFPSGRYLMYGKFVEHKMSTECRYDRSDTDPRCATCKHRGKGPAHFAEVAARSS